MVKDIFGVSLLDRDWKCRQKRFVEGAEVGGWEAWYKRAVAKRANCLLCLRRCRATSHFEHQRHSSFHAHVNETAAN